MAVVDKASGYVAGETCMRTLTVSNGCPTRVMATPAAVPDTKSSRGDISAGGGARRKSCISSPPAALPGMCGRRRLAAAACHWVMKWDVTLGTGAVLLYRPSSCANDRWCGGLSPLLVLLSQSTNMDSTWSLLAGRPACNNPRLTCSACNWPTWATLNCSLSATRHAYTLKNSANPSTWLPLVSAAAKMRMDSSGEKSSENSRSPLCRSSQLINPSLSVSRR
mmetsp:Transcript_11149/g.21183  ORF Transcript_11149/g.21183 Transcript_11149/m.21183 type:complete len:222 (-) Transcript_11149:147-812(-)